jgi:hypothetical protein
MNSRANPILVGIIAGLATAIMMAGSAYASFFAVILIIAAMTSIFIAGLGYGTTSSIIAIATAGAAMAALNTNVMSFVGLVALLLPAAVMSYLAHLARPASELGGPDTALAWYPLSDILLAGAVVTSLATIATLSLHPDIDAVYSALAEMILAMTKELNPQMPAGAMTKEQLAGFFQVLFPLVQSMHMMIALFGGFYFAMRILTAAGRSTRPREDIRSSLRMNRLAIGVFLAGIALMFAGDKLAMIGGSFAGAAAGGFVLSGFAIIHNALRSKTWALPGLILIYLLTFFFLPVIGLLIIIAGGLANPRRAVALTPNNSNQTPTNQP